jgi:hypothetical protein
MYTSHTLNVSWNPTAIMLKLCMVLLAATLMLYSCDPNNDYDDHDTTATHAERTLR